MRILFSNSNFNATPCEAGTLLRNATLEIGANRARGVYVPLAGPDAQKVYRVTLDSEGKEIDRKFMAAPKSRNGFAIVNEKQVGWKQFRMVLRADVATNPRGTAAAGPTAKGAPKDQGSRYGQLALNVSNGEVLFRNFVVNRSYSSCHGASGQITSTEFREVQLTELFDAEVCTASHPQFSGLAARSLFST